MEAHHYCLNCNSELTTPYCGNCGQKASTHRYSMAHFVEHDLVHGVWHVDKGIFRTIKDLFTAPGHGVRAFVLGKRVNYFNFITLLLTLVAISAILSNYTHFNYLDVMPEASRKSMNPIQRFTAEHPKLVLLITIPLNSLFSFLWFRKAKFNYSEHLVLNSYKTAAEMIMSMILTAITVFYYDTTVIMIVYFLISVASIAYTVWFYYQFFWTTGYTKFGLFLRSLMVPMSYLFLSLLIGMVYGIILALGK